MADSPADQTISTGDTGGTDAPASGNGGDNAGYRVLARKYRPTTFDEMIGQDALVRTLTHAIDSGRLAHAFILTGVRGVGKTTTARLIAKALNCTGPDGTGGPTIRPCNQCDSCRAIAEDRHVDVLELDAASRTGVDDVREIIDGVHYRPAAARYKVYIIDEVHMLSRNAFNALLKTLEEPPAHVKFLFATTEIRKVPVTVLSRCQRFDLRRVEQQVLQDYFADIAGREGATVDDAGLALIAQAADGSVRDGLSLLDQAIAHGGGQVNGEQVRAMLGLADRQRSLDLLESLLTGELPAAIDTLRDQYNAGADPEQVLADMLEITHWLTRLRVTPDTANGPEVGEAQRLRGQAMAERLSLPELTRLWQMLLKGLDELRLAPVALRAAEMILVRIAYATDLPSPADIIAQLKQQEPARPALSGSGTAGGAATTNAMASRNSSGAGPSARRTGGGSGGETTAALAMPPDAETDPQAMQAAPPQPLELQSFEDVVRLADEKREAKLRANLINNVHLVHFEPGRIEFSPSEHAEASLANLLAKFLNENTDRKWLVTVTGTGGAPTLHQQKEEAAASLKRRAAEFPLVKAAMNAFPGATIETVRQLMPEEPSPMSEEDNEENP